MLVRQRPVQRVPEVLGEIGDFDQLRVRAIVHATHLSIPPITTDTSGQRICCIERITVLSYATHMPDWQHLAVSADEVGRSEESGDLYENAMRHRLAGPDGSCCRDCAR